MQIKRIALGGIIMTVIMFTPTYVLDESDCRRKKCHACTDFSCMDACKETIYRTNSGNKKSK